MEATAVETTPLVATHKLKVAELKEELTRRGQPVSGTKPELRDRLVQALTKDLTVINDNYRS